MASGMFGVAMAGRTYYAWTEEVEGNKVEENKEGGQEEKGGEGMKGDENGGFKNVQPPLGVWGEFEFVKLNKYADKENESSPPNTKQPPLTLIYFTGSWCPPCKVFTPVLKDFVSQANELEPNR